MTLNDATLEWVTALIEERQALHDKVDSLQIAIEVMSREADLQRRAGDALASGADAALVNITGAIGGGMTGLPASTATAVQRQLSDSLVLYRNSRQKAGQP